MAQSLHLLLTASGDYTASDLSEEFWQVGVRLSCVFGSTDAVGALPDDITVGLHAVARTETDWTIDGNWRLVDGLSIFQPDDYLNDQAAPAFDAWMAANVRSNRCRLRTLKIYPIGSPNGKAIPAPPYASGTPVTLSWTGSYPVGGNAGDQLPLQNAVVASHRTNQIGRKGRGRMFWPALTVGGLDADGFLSTTGKNVITTAQVALLEGLAYGTFPADPVEIRPCVTGSPWTTYATINQVQVGNVVDTQRRRRNSLTEARQTAPVTY